jgi:O-antigen/teichoic acid export membrane protein
MSKYAKLSAGFLAAWLVFALFSSALHLYENAPNTPPIALGLAVLTPVVLFLVWFASSTGFRQFILSLSPRAVTLVQSVRVAGIVFLALGTYKVLPAYFALSAGWATSSSARLHRSRRFGWPTRLIAEVSSSVSSWESPT